MDCSWRRKEPNREFKTFDQIFELARKVSKCLQNTSNISFAISFPISSPKWYFMFSKHECKWSFQINLLSNDALYRLSSFNWWLSSEVRIPSSHSWRKTFCLTQPHVYYHVYMKESWLGKPSLISFYTLLSWLKKVSSNFFPSFSTLKHQVQVK